MYPANAYGFLVPLIAALNSTSYPYESDYRDRSNVRPWYNAEPDTQNGYNAEPDTYKGYNARPDTLKMFDAGPDTYKGYNARLDSHSGYNDHKKVMDASKVCDNVGCGTGQCNPVIINVHSTPEPFCGTVDGHPQVPADANAGCRVYGLTTAVLMGDIHAFSHFDHCLAWIVASVPTVRSVSATFAVTASQTAQVLADLFQDTLQFRDRTYTLSADVVANDRQARAICEAQGGYLVEIESEEENQALVNFVRQANLGPHQGVMISGTDVVDEGNFVFQYSGRYIEYNNFATGQPDNDAGGEDCLELSLVLDYQWNDFPCDDGEQYFICEFPTVPQKRKHPGYYH